MFDYDPETDDLVEPVESFIPEVTPGAGDFDKLDPAQVHYHNSNKYMLYVNSILAVTYGTWQKFELGWNTGFS
jgi:hypothetical protein